MPNIGPAEGGRERKNVENRMASGRRDREHGGFSRGRDKYQIHLSGTAKAPTRAEESGGAAASTRPPARAPTTTACRGGAACSRPTTPASTRATSPAPTTSTSAGPTSPPAAAPSSPSRSRGRRGSPCWRSGSAPGTAPRTSASASGPTVIASATRSPFTTGPTRTPPDPRPHQGGHNIRWCGDMNT